MRVPRAAMAAAILNEAYTVTLGDRAENEAGMQIIGDLAPNGVAAAHLEQLHDQLQANGHQCRLIGREGVFRGRRSVKGKEQEIRKTSRANELT